jgi:hypothetical protein
MTGSGGAVTRELLRVGTEAPERIDADIRIKAGVVAVAVDTDPVVLSIDQRDAGTAHRTLVGNAPIATGKAASTGGNAKKVVVAVAVIAAGRKGDGTGWQRGIQVQVGIDTDILPGIPAHTGVVFATIQSRVGRRFTVVSAPSCTPAGAHDHR